MPSSNPLGQAVETTVEPVPAPRSLGRAALVALAAAVGVGCSSTGDLGFEPHDLPEAIEPSAPVRVPAEWESARGVLVHYPFELPDRLVIALAHHTTLFVLVDGAELDDLSGDMWRLGLEPRRTRRGESAGDVDTESDAPVPRWEAVTAPASEPYPRDHGPHLIEVGGELAVLDQVFQGYPIYGAGARRDAPDVAVSMLVDEGGEDEIAQAAAAYFDLPRYVAPFALTGGNFLVDGAGTAFFTAALVDENRAWYDAPAYFDLLERYTGCTNLVQLANVEGVGIQHVDCWLKPLPGGRLLVQQPPRDHPAHARIEAAVAELRAARDANGAAFEILRLPCPVVDRWSWGDEAPLAAYTNALILNDAVFVPLYGVPGDEVALAVWREALPNHRVEGFLDDAGGAERIRREPDPEPEDERARRRRRPAPTPPERAEPPRDWQSFDALHCRTRAVFDAPADSPTTNP